MPPTFDQIEDFDWLPELEQKILVKHGVLRNEVEECFFEPGYKIFRSAGEKYELLSRSSSGRYLFVVYAWKGKLVRIISARDMTRRDRILYNRK